MKGKSPLKENYELMRICQIQKDIIGELERAEKLHPHWPDDIIHQVAIMVEESGEAMRAALNHVYEKNDIYSVREELIQCSAMCLRCLINLE